MSRPGRITVASATFAVDGVSTSLHVWPGLGAAVVDGRPRWSCGRGRGGSCGRGRRAAAGRVAAIGVGRDRARAPRAAALRGRRRRSSWSSRPGAVVVAPRRRGGRRAGRGRRGRLGTSRGAPRERSAEHRTEPQLGGLADELVGLLAFFTPGRSTTMLLPWRLTSGSAMPRPSTRLTDDVDRGVERRQCRSPSPGTARSTCRPGGRGRARDGSTPTSVADEQPTMMTTVDHEHDDLSADVHESVWPRSGSVAVGVGRVGFASRPSTAAPIAPRATRMTVPGAISRSAVGVAELDDRPKIPLVVSTSSPLDLTLERPRPAAIRRCCGRHSKR